MEGRVNSLLVICLVLMLMAAATSGTRAKLPNTKFHYYSEKLRRNLLANNLGATPPMGWNSWNHFYCNVNETVIMDAADALVSNGLVQLGYTYVNIDDCWAEKTRDANGNLVAKNTTFPSGIKALADYVHARGLKLGIYSSAGYYTCSQTMPGSLGFEEQDAKTFASWGVDYLKYDNCYNDGTKPTVRYPVMTRALMKAGRPIYFSLCEWGDMHPATWGFHVGNSWRTTGDIQDNYESMMTRAGLNNDYADYARPGGWNDADMLEIGNGGMSKEQYIIHFSLWAMIKSPLLLGCDLTNLSKDTLEIITNKEVIAINQDPLGIQAKKIREDVELWAGPLSGYRFVALIVNGMNYDSNSTVHLEDIGIPANTPVQVRDLWEHKTLEDTPSVNLTVTVKSYSSKMFLLTPITKPLTN